MRSLVFILFLGLLSAAGAQAQEGIRQRSTANGQSSTQKGRLDIQLNKNVLQPGDSLVVTVDYRDEAGRTASKSLATLELVIENENGRRFRLRWPMINGQASGALYLPPSIPQGKYTLFAGLQQRFFEVIGQIEDAENINTIEAMLLTNTGEWDEQQVTVSPDGSFGIRNWLFEDNALVAFSATNKNSGRLKIRISTQLDSSHNPVAVAGRSFYVGNRPSAVRGHLDSPIETPASAFEDRGTLLPAVVVTGTVKNPSQQFDEKYVSGLFRSANERTINVMDDPSATGFFNIFSYLQGRIAGLQISPAGFGGGIARWRGLPVTFFLDEVRVPAEQIASLPMTDIAIVKAYPSPFVGAPGGNSAIAIYTRRGGETNYLPPNKQVFKVRGYTPASTVLDMTSASL